jgi:hypothetical protein
MIIFVRLPCKKTYLQEESPALLIRLPEAVLMFGRAFLSINKDRSAGVEGDAPHDACGSSGNDDTPRP